MAYPTGSQVTEMGNTLELKRWWLYNEWPPISQFSPYIQKFIPDRSAIWSSDRPLIEKTFWEVRGQWLLWQTPREQGHWQKVVVPALKIEWIKKNVEVLYPSDEWFPVDRLHGIVLWKDREGRYKLHEGNHRVSAWLASGMPESLPAILYIGKTGEE